MVPAGVSRSGRTRQAFRRLPGALRTLSRYRSPFPEQPSCVSCTFGRPFACSDDSPRSRAPISTSRRARSCCSPARTAPARPPCCGCARGCCRCDPGSAEVLGVDLAVDRRSIRRSLALVGHETFCYDDLTVQENIRFATRAAGPVGRRRRRRARTPRARPGRRASRTAGSRRASGAGSRSRSRSRAIRASCCSTNRTRVSTSRAASVLDEVVRAAPAEGRTVLLASHELERGPAARDARGPDRGGPGARRAAGDASRARRSRRAEARA